MATVFIPSMLRPSADNREWVDVPGSTVHEVIERLTAAYPELQSRLLEEGQLRGNISVAIDGEISTLGLLDSLEDDSEVHFVAAISGGGPDAEPVG